MKNTTNNISNLRMVIALFGILLSFIGRKLHVNSWITKGTGLLVTNIGYGVGDSISDYLGEPHEYYGGPFEDLLGALFSSTLPVTESVSHGYIISARSITPFKKNDVSNLVTSTNAAHGDPVNFKKSVVSAAGSASITITQAELGRDSVYPFLYLVLAIPQQLKAKHIVDIMLTASTFESRAGNTNTFRTILSDKEDSIITMFNFVATSSAPQPLNISVKTGQNLTVTVLGLPDEAVLSAVLPGATDAIRLATERKISSLDKA